MAGTCRLRRPTPSAGRRKRPSNRLVRAISALRSRKSTPDDGSLAITTHRGPRMRLPWRTPGGGYRRPPALPERAAPSPCAVWRRPEVGPGVLPTFVAKAPAGTPRRRAARTGRRGRPGRRRRSFAPPRPALPCPIRAGRGSTIPRPPRPREREMMERRHDGGTAPSTRRRAGKTPRPVSPKDRHGTPHRVIAP